MPAKKTTKKTTTKRAVKTKKTKTAKKKVAKKQVKKKTVAKKVARKKAPAKKAVKKKTTARKKTPKKTVKAKSAKKRVVKQNVKSPKGSVKTKKKTTPRKSSMVMGTKITVKKADPIMDENVSSSNISAEDQKKIEQIRQNIALNNQTEVNDEYFEFTELSDLELGFYDGRKEEEALEEDAVSDYQDTLEQEYYEDLNRFSHRQRVFLLYSSMAVIMIAIGAFWFIGIKDSLGLGFDNSSDPQAEQTTQELNEAINSLIGNIENAKNEYDDKKQEYGDLYEETRKKIIEQQVKSNVVDMVGQKINELNQETKPQDDQTDELNINNNQ